MSNLTNLKSHALTAIYTTDTDKEKNAEELHQFSDRYLIRMLWRYLKPYSWQLVGVVLLLFGESALQLLLPYLIKLAVDGPIMSGNLNGVIRIGAGFVVATAGVFILRYAYLYWLATIGQTALVRLRQDMFEHILRQDMAYFSKTPVGRVVARMSNDVEALTELLSTSVVILVANSVTLVGIIIVMLWLNWRLALISLAVLPVMGILTVYFRGRIRAAANRFHRIMAAYLAYLNEQFNGMLVVQLFNRQRRTREDFQIINQDYFDTHTDMRNTYTYYASVLQVLTTLGLALVLWGGGQGVLAQWPGVTIGILLAFIEYTRQSFEPILNLAEQFTQIQTALSAGERIAQMLEVQPQVQPPAHPTPVTDFVQSVEFEGVTFGYDPEHPILNDITLNITPGQRVAIVGATGTGKSTLVKLLARFYDVDRGSIRVAGVDIRQLSTADLRRLVSVVPQDPYCFTGTIADNLRMFRDDITLEQMQVAAATSAAQDFIERLPNGYNFQLLSGGTNLSQGQRQLLALTRAILHSPESILILDEATSSIDTETETLIQAGLTKILAGRTSIIIAHRLSTVRDADRILVMREGHIVEDGTHEQLLALGGRYANLYYRQFSGKDDL